MIQSLDSLIFGLGSLKEISIWKHPDSHSTILQSLIYYKILS
jgi:hypothetical protein